MISKIDGSVMLNIGGENRKIKYTLNSLEEIESYLPIKHLFTAVHANGAPILSISLLITATWVGLKYFDKKLSRDTVSKWIEEYLQEVSIEEFSDTIVASMGLVGTLGKISVFKDILNKKTETEVTETEGKQYSDQ